MILAPFCTTACSMNGDQTSQASTLPEENAASALGRLQVVQLHVVGRQARLGEHGSR